MSSCRPQQGLSALAPEKSDAHDQARDGRRSRTKRSTRQRRRARTSAPRFAPAGQSTQMIVGADAATDRDDPATAPTLYARIACGASITRRSVRSRDASRAAAAHAAAAAARASAVSGRLADALLRIHAPTRSRRRGERQAAISTSIPKLAWALRIASAFPVDVNRAEREMLLRVPGLGVRSVDRIDRRAHGTRASAVRRLAPPPRVARCVKRCRSSSRDRLSTTARALDELISRIARRRTQLELFDPAVGIAPASFERGRQRSTVVRDARVAVAGRCVRTSAPHAPDGAGGQHAWLFATVNAVYYALATTTADRVYRRVFRRSRRSVICHRDPQSALRCFIALLWRLAHGEPTLIGRYGSDG